MVLPSFSLSFGGESVQEVATVLVAKVPKDYINIDRTNLPFREVVTLVAGLLKPEDDVPQLRELFELIEQGRKAVAKKLLKAALLQAADLFARRQESLVDEEKRIVLARQLRDCLDFFAEEQIVGNVEEAEAPAFCAACAVPGAGAIAVSTAS